MKWPPGNYQPDRRVFEEGKAYLQLRIGLKPDHGLVEIPGGQAVAVLEMDCSRALSLCENAPGFRIDAWALETEWNDKVAEAHKSQTNRRKVVLMGVKLALFGQRDSGDQIATALGRFKQFLQPPDTGMVDCCYENPQLLQLPDPPPRMQKADNDLPVALMTEESDEMTVNPGKLRDGEAARICDLITDIEDWFDKLPAYRCIAMASTDSRILTTLFR
jgi:hypothetical protein